MWRGKRDTEAQEVDIPATAYASSPISRSSQRGWQRIPNTFPGWIRGSLLAAILIGFPVSNFLFFMSLNQLPIENGEPRQPGMELTSDHPGTHSVHHERLLANAHSMDGWGTAGQSEQGWEDLTSKVAQDDLFNRYQHYFNSESRALQGYGRILVVSDAFLGPVDASGPATAMTTLSELLFQNGFDVTMLYTEGKAAVQKGTWELWEDYWSSRGLHLVALPDSPVSYDVAQENAMSHRVYLWLKETEAFDVIHFSDIHGVGYWTLKAKHQGLAFQRTAVAVHMLAPHLWRKVGSLEALDNVRDLMVDFMQRESVKHADLVVAPSKFILNWAVENGWESLLDSGRVVQSYNLLPAWVSRRARAESDEMPFREIVFFSRLELRKGLLLFCDVLDRIERRSPALLKGIQVTFLGASTPNQTLPLPDNPHASTHEYIRFRGVKWRSFSWSIVSELDSQGRVDYMMAGSRLAVLPMIAENSPYAVQECIVAAIPFLATRVGGVGELLVFEDHERLLTDPTPKAITNRLVDVLRNGLKPAQPTQASQYAVNQAWVVWHHIMLHRTQALGMDATMQLQRHPLVTVCIVHFNNPTLLKQAIDSLESGAYQNFQVVVVDDGSTDPAAQRYLEEINLYFQTKGWKIGQQESRGPGAGRNLAASLASPETEYFMFMDDDNIAKPHEILTFLSVAMHTGAQVLTCVNDYFFGNDYPSITTHPIGRWVPLGAAREVGMFQNMYGDTNAMLHRDVFQAVGGFPEDFGYALEDWELFSKCVLAGFHLEAVPDPLYWYRLRDTSHSRVTATYSNNMRSIRPYLKTIPQGMHHLVLFAQGMKSSHDFSQKELKDEAAKTVEMRNMLKALASSIHSVCQDGKFPATSKNRLANADFQQGSSPDEGYPTQGWKPFERGYQVDFHGGRPPLPSAESAPPRQRVNQAIRMTNTDWRQSSGATRQVVLNQDRPGAVVVSGWSKAEKVSGHADGGYALYIDVVYQDGSKLWGYEIPFDVGTHDWQYKASVLDADVPIEWLQVYTMFRWHSGTAWFDDVAVTLLKEGLCDYSQLALDGIAQDDMDENQA